MPTEHNLHNDIPEEPAPVPTSDAEAYAKGREDERRAIVEWLERVSPLGTVHVRTIADRIRGQRHVQGFDVKEQSGA